MVDRHHYAPTLEQRAEIEARKALHRSKRAALETERLAAAAFGRTQDQQDELDRAFRNWEAARFEGARQ